MCTYEQMPPTAKSAHNYMKHFVKQRFAGELLKANSCTSLSSTSRLYSDDCVYSDEPLYDDESAVLVGPQPNPGPGPPRPSLASQRPLTVFGTDRPGTQLGDRPLTAFSSASALDHRPPPGSSSGAAQQDTPNHPPFRNIVWRREEASPARAQPAAPPTPEAPARVLLDLFAGRHSPIAVAASKQGIPHWEPIDIAINEAHDILSDSFFTRLLRLAWSGRIALLVAAPPCRDYSILKLAPGGPPPCRTPEHLNGLPSDSPTLTRRAAGSRCIHERCHQLCRAVAASGGTWVLENPPSSMAWMEPSCQQLLRASAAHVASVAACTYGMIWSKSWAFASNSPHIRGVQQNCAHAFKHPSLRNKRDKSGRYISSSTAEYPAELACNILEVFRHLWPNSPPSPAIPLPMEPPTPERMAGPGPRAPACDGAGLQSTADCSKPAKPHASLLSLIDQMQTWCLQADRYKRIAAHIAQSKPEHPLSEEEQQSLLEMAAASLDLPQQSAAAVDDGQPFRLKLLSRLGLACLTQDIDKGLPDILAQGVPTGVFEPIASSHQWPAVEAQHAQHPLDTCLKEFDSNWKNAEAQPELLQRLIEEEMAQGWVIEIPGGEQEARAQWPKGIARQRWMVLDSSVCNVNPRCTLPERVCLPTSADFAPPSSLWTPQMPRRAPRSISKPPTSASRYANQTKAYCFSETRAAYTPTWFAILEHAFQPTGGSA